MTQAVAANAGEREGAPHARPESLRAAHLRQHGEVPPIGEANYRNYDRWFVIQRRSGMTWLDYVYEVCDIMERVLADLMVGHRLEAAIVNDLVESIRAVLAVFAEQASKVNESFAFIPQQLSIGSYAAI